MVYHLLYLLSTGTHSDIVKMAYLTYDPMGKAQVFNETLS